MSQMGFPAFFLFHQAATCTPELWASSENMEEFFGNSRSLRKTYRIPPQGSLRPRNSRVLHPTWMSVEGIRVIVVIQKPTTPAASLMVASLGASVARIIPSLRTWNVTIKRSQKCFRGLPVWEGSRHLSVTLHEACQSWYIIISQLSACKLVAHLSSTNMSLSQSHLVFGNILHTLNEDGKV